MLSTQRNTTFRRITTDEHGTQYSTCVQCGKCKHIEAFDPITNNIPAEYIRSRSTNWFEKFTTYQPLQMSFLKTTLEELAGIWKVSVKTIEKAIESGRLVRTPSRIYINSYPWEPQFIC